MVKYQEIDLNRILYAISDPTRRRILDELYRGAKSVGEVAEPFKISLPAILKHIKILRESGLIETKKTGRRVTCNIEPDNLMRVATWLARFEKLWERRLQALEQNIKQNKPETPI